MPIYRKCSQCFKKVPIGTQCSCEMKQRKESYKAYKQKRLLDNEERERQKFYTSIPWLVLSENVKKKYYGLCVLCWYEKRIQVNEFTHHIETLKERFDSRFDENNLVPLCDCCHKHVHSKYDESEKEKRLMQRHLNKIIYIFKNTYS